MMKDLLVLVVAVITALVTAERATDALPSFLRRQLGSASLVTTFYTNSACTVSSTDPSVSKSFGYCYQVTGGKSKIESVTSSSSTTLETSTQSYSDSACQIIKGAPTTNYYTLDTCSLVDVDLYQKSSYASPVASPVASPTSGSSGSSSSSSCFASSDTVQLEDGSIKALSEVQLGDRILTARLDGLAKGFSYSPVIAVPHAGEEQTAATFVQLSTAEKDIKMTADHLVLAGSCSAVAALPLVQARSVSVGDCLQTAEGKVAVTAVRSVQGKGLSSAVTLAGDLIVVNGIAASPFALSHRIGEAWYVIHRALFTVLPAALGFSFFQKTSERFGDLAVRFSL